MSGGRTQRSVRGDIGQATVELALSLPVVFLAMLLVLQASLVLRAQLMVCHAARVAARTASIDSEADVKAAALAALPGIDPATVRAVAERGGSGGGQVVRVSVSDVVHTDVPLVGPLVGDITVAATSAMPVEST